MAISSTIKWMVSESYNWKMDKDMKGNGHIMKSMVLDNINGQMDVFIVVVTPTEKEMEKEKWFTRMENNIKEIGLMDKNMEEVFIALVLSNLWDNGVGAS